ncbi:MAG: hypothetical protein ACO3X1_08655 [Burkholderiaceae bacterium]
MGTKKEIFKDILKVKGDTALLDAKYIGVSADDIIDCYHELNISSPINLIENTWLKNWYSDGNPQVVMGGVMDMFAFVKVTHITEKNMMKFPLMFMVG